MKRCYICGSTDNLTKDHIPPKNLFLEPLPSNLITVSCCRTCNESLTLDDEAFRVFVSGYIGRSKAGEWIWQNKVMGSSFRRSPTLKENVRKSLKNVGVDPLTGMVHYGIRFPADRAKRYLTRITKGLMAHLHPNLDYSDAVFSISHIGIMDRVLIDMLSKLKYDERGNGVFRFWRAIYTEVDPEAKPTESLWFYMFYDGVLFMVEVD